MRRRANDLIPIEAEILAAAVALQDRGAPEFHGYLLAREIREQEGAKLLRAYGTLYKALERLEAAGLLRSRWEEAEIAEGEGRPRRRLYEITDEGERRVGERRRAAAVGVPQLARGSLIS